MIIKRYLFKLICGLILIYVTLLAWMHLTASTQILNNDYKTFYRSLRVKHSVYKTHFYTKSLVKNKQGQLTLLSEHVNLITAINLNTPSMNLLLKGLIINGNSGKLGIDTLIWTLASLLGAGLSIVLIAPSYLIPVWLTLWMSWPSVQNQLLGQVSFFVLPFLSSAFVLGLKKRFQWMAVILGLVASLKLFFLFFALYFVLRSEWKAFFIFIISFLFFSFVPLVYFSSSDYILFFSNMRNPHIIMERIGLWINGSVTSFINAIMVLFQIKFTTIESRVIYLLLGSYITICWIWYYHQFLKKLQNHLYELSFAFTVILSLLLSPLGWVYYYVFLLIPVFVIFNITENYRVSTLFYYCFFIALVLPILSYLDTKIFILQTVQHLSASVDLLCWLFTMHLLAKAINHHQLIEDERTFFHPQVILCCLLGASLVITFVLLAFNYTNTYFFSWDKTAYFHSRKAGFWLEIQSAVPHKNS